MDYGQAEKILKLQNNSSEIMDNIGYIINNENSLTVIALNAYHLGLINGKRSERSRRAHK